MTMLVEFESVLKVLTVALAVGKRLVEKRERRLDATHAPTPLLWGHVGVGKTAAIRQIFTSLGMELVHLSVGQHDPTDFTGLPVPDLAAGKVRFIPPDFLVKEQPFGLFLDEINRASPAQVNAALRLISERRIGEYDLKVVPVAAANPDDIGVQELSAAALNRCLHLPWELPRQAWSDFMTKGESSINHVVQQVPYDKIAHADLFALAPIVDSFLASNPSLYDQGAGFQEVNQQQTDSLIPSLRPTPRGWTGLTVILSALWALEPNTEQGNDFGFSEGFIRVAGLVASGIVGVGAASPFVAFLQKVRVPRPEVVLADPKVLQEKTEDIVMVALSQVLVFLRERNYEERLWKLAWNVLVQLVKWGRDDLAWWYGTKLAEVDVTPPWDVLKAVAPQLLGAIKQIKGVQV